MWFRRDLRLSDHPALGEAARSADEVVPLFVVDPSLWRPAGSARRRYLLGSLAALDHSMDGALVRRSGNPVETVVTLARAVGASSVHISADYGPYGAARDAAVERALSDIGVDLVRTGSPYAVAPGRVVKGDGTPYRVYSPFYRAWLSHGWRAPAAPPNTQPNTQPKTTRWAMGISSDPAPTERQVGSLSSTLHLPPSGEAAALDRWHQFRGEALAHYAQDRNRPDVEGSSRLSVHLKYGEIHPRTLLADLGDSVDHEVFRKELAWREFYADVLHHAPDTAREYLRPEFAHMLYDSGPNAETHLLAWQQGRTGYPIVDAGMRQLLHEGWMHNRVRMIVASFLVKDLHLEWQLGARWFMRHLVDGDIASNAHGWQWTAGCGTDASPYFRIFNPITQGQRFDPAGDYVRRYVPELRHVSGPTAHEPWNVADGYMAGYAQRIVDHAVERRESLERYGAIKNR
ncbi:MAG: DNA photolyase family protein [Actinomycetia bacterium]|nr:DNA photolyase family protein [Actinomycetes bacterium]